MNIPKLESCPHCGSRDLAIEVSSTVRIRPGLSSGRWNTANVHCVTCRCSTGDITMSKKTDAIHFAALRWNSRAEGGKE